MALYGYTPGVKHVYGQENLCEQNMKCDIKTHRVCTACTYSLNYNVLSCSEQTEMGGLHIFLNIEKDNQW